MKKGRRSERMDVMVTRMGSEIDGEVGVAFAGDGCISEIGKWWVEKAKEKCDCKGNIDDISEPKSKCVDRF